MLFLPFPQILARFKMLNRGKQTLQLILTDREIKKKF